MHIQNPERQLPFSLESFQAWYEPFVANCLVPAQQTAVRLLKELLTSKLADSDFRRITVSEGRIKSDVRTYRKLTKKAASSYIAAPEATPEFIKDLVGLRIICTNLSDVRTVVGLFDELEEYSQDGGASTAGLTYRHDVSKNFIETPKPSGYRSIHYYLFVPVPSVTGNAPICCELQVRTLLQDSWGELTHEDTYKPGSHVPGLIHTISRRMADIMATLDDLAQDIRNELIKEENALIKGEDEALSRSQDSEGAGTIAFPTLHDEEASQAKAFLISRYDDLSAPIPLAALAAEVEREFGPGAPQGWFGFGSFLSLLNSALPPNHQQVKGPPGYVLPPGTSVEDFDLPVALDGGYPVAIDLLRSEDRLFPLVKPRIWTHLFAAISEATYLLPRVELSSVRPTQLSKVARDRTRTGTSDGVPLGRNALSYVARSLIEAHGLQHPLEPSVVANIFIDSTVGRLRQLEVSTADIEEAEAWIRGYSGDLGRATNQPID
jgi:ppGpp synthetase/RelA/SpoT-type nucleotidyltranferase